MDSSPTLQVTQQSAIPTPRHDEDFGVQKLVWSESTASALRTLRVDERIVLFTPAVPASEQTEEARNGVDPAQDPFERLGRALSRRHRQIHHVPFVPCVGFTETHRAWADRADAVVIVNCEPAMQDREVAQASLANQHNFTSSLEEALTRLIGRARDLPSVLVNCCMQEVSGTRRFGIVVQCNGYSASHLDAIAHCLFSA